MSVSQMTIDIEGTEDKSTLRMWDCDSSKKICVSIRDEKGNTQAAIVVSSYKLKGAIEAITGDG
jgi:hypothetical protein